MKAHVGLASGEVCQALDMEGATLPQKWKGDSLIVRFVEPQMQQVQPTSSRCEVHQTLGTQGGTTLTNGEVTLYM